MKIVVLLVGMYLSVITAFGQTDTNSSAPSDSSKTPRLEELRLEDLMNVPISSAS